MDARSENHDIEVEGGNNAYERKISGILDDGSVGFQQPLLARNRKNTTSHIAIVGANTCPIESLDYEYSLFLFFWNTNISASMEFFISCLVILGNIDGEIKIVGLCCNVVGSHLLLTILHFFYSSFWDIIPVEPKVLHSQFILRKSAMFFLIMKLN